MGENINIERVTRDNCHMFYDMISWRMKGFELTQEQKKISKINDYAEVYKELENPGFYTYSALCDGRFVGWISIMYTPKIARQRWENGVIYIDELWVAPGYRRKGIAKKLIEKAFECQKDTNAVEVRVYVGDDNIAALELYKKSGLHIESKAIYMKSSANL